MPYLPSLIITVPLSVYSRPVPSLIIHVPCWELRGGQAVAVACARSNAVVENPRADVLRGRQSPPTMPLPDKSAQRRSRRQAGETPEDLASAPSKRRDRRGSAPLDPAAEPPQHASLAEVQRRLEMEAPSGPEAGTQNETGNMQASQQLVVQSRAGASAGAGPVDFNNPVQAVYAIAEMMFADQKEARAHDAAKHEKDSKARLMELELQKAQVTVPSLSHCVPCCCGFSCQV